MVRWFQWLRWALPLLTACAAAPERVTATSPSLIVLGIAQGDDVTVTTATGAITAPAYLYIGIRPDTVAIAAGRGHSAYGRYAAACGANAMSLLAGGETTVLHAPGTWGTSSLMASSRSIGTATTLTECRVLTIPSTDLQRLAEQNAHFGRRLYQELAANIFRRLETLVAEI